MRPAPMPFIVGSGRSGTTLLRSILDSHPDLAIPGENRFLVSQLRGRSLLASGRRLPTEEIEDLVDESVVTRRSFPRRAATRPDADLGDWIRDSYCAYAQRFGKRRYGDKTPELVRHMDPLARLLPEAVFIHVIRDGRNVSKALVDQPWGPPTLGRAAASWRLSVTSGRAAGLRLPRHRYFELRYEDMVADLGPTIAAVCEFIELDFDPAMMDHAASAARAREYSPFPESHANLGRAVQANVRDWHRELSTWQRLMVELRAGPILEVCGYEAALPQSLGRKARLARKRLGRRIRTARIVSPEVAAE